jgi:hypothetical protein
MKMPDLPHFNIPDSCDAPDRRMSLDEYQAWIEENIRFLKEKGLYNELRKDPLRTPVNVRFHIV